MCSVPRAFCLTVVAVADEILGLWSSLEQYLCCGSSKCSLEDMVVLTQYYKLVMLLLHLKRCIAEGWLPATASGV